MRCINLDQLDVVAHILQTRQEKKESFLLSANFNKRNQGNAFAEMNKET